MNSFPSGLPSGEPDGSKGFCIVKNPPIKSTKYFADNDFGRFQRTSRSSQTTCCKPPRFVAKKYRCTFLQHTVEPGKSETRASNGSPTCRRVAVLSVVSGHFRVCFKRLNDRHLRSKCAANASPLLNAGPLTETALNPLAVDRGGGRRPLFQGDGSPTERNSCAKTIIEGSILAVPRAEVRSG